MRHPLCCGISPEWQELNRPQLLWSTCRMAPAIPVVAIRVMNTKRTDYLLFSMTELHQGTIGSVQTDTMTTTCRNMFQSLLSGQIGITLMMESHTTMVNGMIVKVTDSTRHTFLCSNYPLDFGSYFRVSVSDQSRRRKQRYRDIYRPLLRWK